VALSPNIISIFIFFSTKFERASLCPVKCLEAPLSINQWSNVSGGKVEEREEIR